MIGTVLFEVFKPLMRRARDYTGDGIFRQIGL